MDIVIFLPVLSVKLKFVVIFALVANFQFQFNSCLIIIIYLKENISCNTSIGFISDSVCSEEHCVPSFTMIFIFLCFTFRVDQVIISLFYYQFSYCKSCTYNFRKLITFLTV